MNELAIGAVGVLFGFLLSIARDWWQRKRKQSAFWNAISAEADYCRQLADKYLQGEVRAPLYRLPTMAHSSALPILLTDGALDKSEVAALIEFVAEVDELNRGLDRCANAAGEPAQTVEAERNKTIARRLSGAGATFQAAHQVHVNRSSNAA